MRYYSNDWVYTAGAIGANETGAMAKSAEKAGLAKALTLFVPILVVGALYLLFGGKHDPRLATVFIVSGNSSGTGCIFTPNGYILTNRHVVADSSAITVYMGSGTQKQQTFVAQLVTKGKANDAADDSLSEFLKQLPNDFAILKIQATGLAHFRLLDDNFRVRVGTRATAMGYGYTMLSGRNDKGPGQEAPSGTVSAFLPNEEDQRLIIHTCAIQKGFSGGPLIDENGRLIGINTASVPDSIGNNKQVAIPISTFRATLNAYIQGSER